MLARKGAENLKVSKGQKQIKKRTTIEKGLTKNSNKKRRVGALSVRNEAEEERVGTNTVHLVGRIATATTSREGVFGRRIEIPIPGARESLELECENREISPLFRSLKIGEWVQIEGSIRRRFWRSGSTISSRSYIEVARVRPR